MMELKSPYIVRIGRVGLVLEVTHICGDYLIGKELTQKKVNCAFPTAKYYDVISGTVQTGKVPASELNKLENSPGSKDSLFLGTLVSAVTSQRVSADEFFQNLNLLMRMPKGVKIVRTHVGGYVFWLNGQLITLESFISKLLV